MKKVGIIILALLASIPVLAQNNSFVEEYQRFQREAISAYSDFRKECNNKYAEFLLLGWEWFQAKPEIPQPVKEEVPPVIYEEQEQETPIEIEHDEVTISEPVIEEQPQPVAPIEEKPVVKPTAFSFPYFGTSLSVRAEDKNRFVLQSLGKKDLSNTWERLSGPEYDNIVIDCLKIRDEYDLCDWAYLLMLQSFSKAFLKGDNERILMTAYIYSQSGYKMRLATGNGKLYMLYASKHQIYSKSYFEIDGSYYYSLEGEPNGIQIANFSFPKEENMSLNIPHEPKLAINNSSLRKLQSKEYPVSVSCSVNKNLLDFFETYPTSNINDNMMTRWAMYANTPLDEETKNQIYPTLRQAIAGKSKPEAANILLNFVQTSLEYEYDDKVWGHDRAFFAEESLYYPYCDCEDRSILFSHLVRELLGLDILLVYYPGHLSTAVLFDEPVNGDYLVVGAKKYIICDPTYIGAPIGMNMPKMKNQKANVILLK